MLSGVMRNTFHLLTCADAARVARLYALDITPAGIRTAADRAQLPIAARTAGGVRLFSRDAVVEFARQRVARRHR